MYHRVTEDGRILTAARKFFALAASLLVMIFFLRLYEIILTATAGNFPMGSWKMQLNGLQYDFLLLSKLLSYIMIPFLFVGYFKLKAAKYLFLVFSLLLAFFSIGLQQYFSRTLVPLGADLWGYSLAEIKLTVFSSGAVNAPSFLPFLGFSALAVLSTLFFYRMEPKRTFSALFCVVMLVLLPVKMKLTPSANKRTTEFSRYIQCNKLVFFINNNYDYIEQKSRKEKELQDLDAKMAVQAESSLKMVDRNYPFLHKNETPDALGQFFTKGDKLPNLVFLVVESLGRSYSGEGADLGSFTPFLDSLMTKGIYWENFLSTSGRTFSVMPSIFGSLPFGDKGFAEMGSDMPKHISLMSILNKNGYQSCFYYGSDSKFDNMAMFFSKQHAHQFIDQSQFGSRYKKIPPMSNGFTWGYGDRELFDKYFSTLEKKDISQARLDVLLTINMHSPFLLAEQSYYNAKLESHVKKLNLTEDKRKFIHQYSPQLATVLCFDDALKYFFEKFAQRADYNNTIFFITGDHRMPEIPISSQLDRFHVPFLIYSPMLRKTQKISSISTHFDIAPSLLAFLGKNYHISVPSLVAWIGSGLDMEPKFRNIHSYPLMRNKSELIDYIDGENMISNGVLYRISPNNRIDQIQDSRRMVEVDAKFKIYKTNNLFACKKNRIIPDSIVTKY